MGYSLWCDDLARCRLGDRRCCDTRCKDELHQFSSPEQPVTRNEVEPSEVSRCCAARSLNPDWWGRVEGTPGRSTRAFPTDEDK